MKRPFFGAAICPPQGTRRLGMAAQSCAAAPLPHPRRHHRLLMRAAIVRERGTIGAVLARTRRYHPPHAPPTRKHWSAGLLGSGANAHHGDLGGPRHGDALHARHGRGRRERRRKAARNERGGASAHKPELHTSGRARSWRCGAPNDGEDRKHGYLRERAGRERSSKASWSGKKG